MAIEKNNAALPEPIAEGKKGTSAAVVRAQPSLPFDLADPKKQKLLAPPNPANIAGPVQSPEQP